MTVRERARKAQEAHFAGHDEVDSTEVASATEALYDKIDALSPEKKSLLITSCLGDLQRILSGADLGSVQGMLSTALIGVAGYANESSREAEGWTSTGDIAVDEVLDSVQELLSLSVKAQIGPERLAVMDAAAARVKARVAAGEDFATVVAEEEESLKLDADSVPVAKTDDAPDRYSGDGLYL